MAQYLVALPTVFGDLPCVFVAVDAGGGVTVAEAADYQTEWHVTAWACIGLSVAVGMLLGLGWSRVRTRHSGLQ